MNEKKVRILPAPTRTTRGKGHPQGISTLGGYKTAKDGTRTLALRVPQRVAKQIMHLEGSLFSCELTEEGILFRIVQTVQSEDGSKTPEWTT